MRYLSLFLLLHTLSLPIFAADLPWRHEYAAAFYEAQDEEKLLLIRFGNEGESAPLPPESEAILRSYVLADLPMTATGRADNGEGPLLDSPAFQALSKAPGLAIVNLKNKAARYGHVIATLSLGKDQPTATQITQFLESPLRELGPKTHLDEFGLTWHFDYRTAYTKAEQEKKLLAVVFDSEGTRFAQDRATAEQMRDLVLVRLRVEDCAALLRDEGFRQFHGASGVGIVDLKHDGEDHGRLVQVLPTSYLTMAGVRTMIALADRQAEQPALPWHTDYLAARAQAVAEGKMLLIAVDSKDEVYAPRPESQPALCGYVLLRQTTESKYEFEGEPRRLLEYGDFQPLRNRPGLVVYDFKHKDEPYYGEVVSVMPYRYLGPNSGNRVVGEEQRERELLTLEPNTLTRRTLTWAIRVSKGMGISGSAAPTAGRARIRMVGARRNSLLQCRSGCGHFAGGLQGPEIASPGPGEDIVDGALNMVQIWSSSPPHYGVMVSYHPQFGYDMSPSSSNHWYGTGRF